MKKVIAVIMSMAMALSVASCGKGKDDLKNMKRLSPDEIISAETVSTMTGVTMKADEKGVVNDGTSRSVTYVPNPIGSEDPVTIQIEQFSETLTTNQVWSDYENSRIRREDMEFVTGIGQDCYIAYPFINVYDRGCFLRISAGSGDDEEQKELLINLATAAVAQIEANISEEAVEAAADNVIK